MSDVQQLEDAMLHAAQGRGMDPERAETLFAGLAKRIDAGEPAPDPGPLPTDRDRGMVWGPWLLGALVGAAALAALMVGTSLRGEAGTQDNAVAAPYEAATNDEPSRATAQPRHATSARSKSPANLRPELPTKSTPAVVLPEPPAPATDKPKVRTGPKRPRATEPTGASTPVRDVAGEAQALGRVQTALDRGDLSAATRGIAAYRKAHPGGALAPEADGLAVLIDCKRGTADAARKAATFVRRHPRSALRKRIDSACEKK